MKRLGVFLAALLCLCLLLGGCTLRREPESVTLPVVTTTPQPAAAPMAAEG